MYGQPEKLTDSTRRNKGGESDIGRQDRAEEYSSKAIHDRHGIFRSTVIGNSPDPRGEWKHAVSRNGKDKTGGGDGGDTSVEDKSDNGEDGHED